MPNLPFQEVQGVQEAILRCPFDGCNARLIRLQPELYSTRTTIENAPKMARDSTDFFQVADVWDFDNIGVLKATELGTTDSVGPLAKVERLLICSDCDKGPLGFAGYLDSEETDVKKLSYFLSCESILYDVKS